MIEDKIKTILEELPPRTKLVAVSKFHPVEAIEEAYRCGQRCFGESRPQELMAKAKAFPMEDIQWHFIGHLQTNKLKMVLPYVSLVQSVDSLRLLEAINDWGERNGKKICCLLEFHLGAEETKQGFSEEELVEVLSHSDRYPFIIFCGLMGMATHTSDEALIRNDFARIAALKEKIRQDFPNLEDFVELSIGMSGDWKIAVEYGATYVRIGTYIFGPRDY